MLTGAISKFGETYSVTLNLLDTEGADAGEVRQASENCKCNDEQLLMSVQKLAASVIAEKSTIELEEVKKREEEAWKKRLAEGNKQKGRACPALKFYRQCAALFSFNSDSQYQGTLLSRY